MQTVDFIKVRPEAITPSRGTPGAAGLDLYSTHDIRVDYDHVSRICTGIAMTLPHNTVGLVKPRSGLAMNNGIDVLAGVIDADFRGEIIVGLTRVFAGTHFVRKGDKIAQLVIQPFEYVNLQEVDKLGGTHRNERGFGSTD